MDRTTDLLQVWLKLYKVSLSFWIMVVTLISNKKHSFFSTSPIFPVRRELKQWCIYRSMNKNCYPRVLQKQKYSRTLTFAVGFDVLRKSVDSLGYERSWLRSVYCVVLASETCLYFILILTCSLLFCNDFVSWLWAVWQKFSRHDYIKNGISKSNNSTQKKRLK